VCVDAKAVEKLVLAFASNLGSKIGPLSITGEDENLYGGGRRGMKE